MIGFVRTRIAAAHSPSPLMEGCTSGAMSSGRLGIVVVDVVVVTEGSGARVDVVDVDVVELVVGAVAEVAGHDCVATVGILRAGEAEPAMVVVVVFDGRIVEEVTCVSMVVSEGIDVVVSGARVSKVTSASESAGATAGALLWVHVSS